MLSMIGELLELDRLESGSVALEKSELLLSELVKEAFALVGALADKSKIALIDEVNSATVNADKERILQVLVNLISNAIKFSPPESQIVVSSLLQNEETVIRVTDKGRGVPEKFRESIFERFKQVEANDRSEKGGAGLGLAISKTIVEAHGGKIGVSSELESGSTFWFTLPRSSK